MIVGTGEVTPEDREMALKLIAERRKQVPTRYASKSFVDRMTSGSADPDAAEAKAAAQDEAKEKHADTEVVFRP